MKINKLYIVAPLLILGIAGVLLYLFSISNKAEKTDNVLGSEFIQQWGKNEVIIGLDQEFPPITFRNENGEIVGFDVDLAKEAFKRIGLTPVFKPMDWATIVASLQNGDIDLVWSGMTITSERQQKINFTDPYFKGSYVYIFGPNSSINSKSDLSGKIVGVQAGSSNEEALKADPIAAQIKEIKSYSSFQECLLDLDNGRLDAIFSDGTFAFYYINTKNISYKTIEEPSTDLGAGVGIRKSDIEMLNKLNETLNAMKSDGTATRISMEWFGKDYIAK